MSWIVFTLIAVFFLATGDITQQYGLKKENSLDENSSTILTILIQVFIALIAIGIYRYDFINNAILLFNKYGIQLILAAAFAALGTYFYFKSFKVKNISFSVIFVSLSVFVSTYLGIIFLNESLTLIKVIGAILVFASVVTVNYKNSIIEQNNYYGLVAAVLLGGAYFFDKLIVTEVEPLVYITLSFIVSAVILVAVLPKRSFMDISRISKNSVIVVITSGIAYFLYNFFTFNAYRLGGEVGRIDAINNTQVFLIIAFEYFVIKEKTNLKKKIVATALATVGVLLLSINFLGTT